MSQGCFLPGQAVRLKRAYKEMGVACSFPNTINCIYRKLTSDDIAVVIYSTVLSTFIFGTGKHCLGHVPTCCLELFIEL